MTRINVVPVKELSDQHLIAEYHELPRVFKKKINIADAPEKYCLGKGHVKWAKKHINFVAHRFGDLLYEIRFRGFKTKYDDDNHLFGLMWAASSLVVSDYKPTDEDMELNRQRIREKYQLKPSWYRWTKRQKPDWL